LCYGQIKQLEATITINEEKFIEEMNFGGDDRDEIKISTNGYT